MSLPAFSSLIAEKIARFGEDIADACERFANDRETWLLNENKRLLAENTELQRRFESLTERLSKEDQLSVQKASQDTWQESWREEHFATISCVPFVKPSFVSEHLTSHTDIDALGAIFGKLAPNQTLDQKHHAQALTMSSSGVNDSVPQAKRINYKVCACGKPIADDSESCADCGLKFSLHESAESKKSGTSMTHHFHFLLELCEPAENHLVVVSDDRVESSDVGFTHRLSKMHHAINFVEKASHAFILDPSSYTRLCWDMIGIPVLSWDLLTIPMGVFKEVKSAKLVMGIAEWITLSYWTADIPMTFFTAIYDEDGDEIIDHGEIARRYLRGQFSLDSFMVGTEWIVTFFEWISTEDSPGFLKNVALFRILRIARFARLARLRKLKSKLQAVEDSFSSEWCLIIADLLIKVFTILVVNHYIGCGWYLLGNSTDLAPPLKRWVSALPYPQYGSNGGKFVDATLAYKYTTSLHWALAQFTPGPHPIQPQNPWERMYAVFVLLFGMIVFSSFVASVTQARLQMTRMMGKFERDHWLLREFCRQQKVSTPLQLRMKRYVDIVVLPAQARLSLEEIVFIKKLSPNLRQQLNSELYSAKLCVHPFFQHVHDRHTSVMNGICTQAIESMPLARGDVAFVGGQMAHFMIIVVSGFLDYIPIRDVHKEVHVLKGQWISEATFWTKWMHQGQLQASTESSVVSVDGAMLRRLLLRSAVAMLVVRKYGPAFCDHLNELAQQHVAITDLQDYASVYFKEMKESHSTPVSFYKQNSSKKSSVGSVQ